MGTRKSVFPWQLAWWKWCDMIKSPRTASNLGRVCLVRRCFQLSLLLWGRTTTLFIAVNNSHVLPHEGYKNTFPGRHFLSSDRIWVACLICFLVKWKILLSSPFSLPEIQEDSNGSFTYKGMIPLSQPYKWWELSSVVLLVLLACFTIRHVNNTSVVSKQVDTTVIFISTLVQVMFLQACWFQGLSC